MQGVSRTKRIRCRGTETKLPSRTSGASGHAVGTEARSGSFEDTNALRPRDPPRCVRGPRHWSRQSRSSGRAEIHQKFPRARSQNCGVSVLSRVHSFADGGSTMRSQWLIRDLPSVVLCPQICPCMTWRRQFETHFAHLHANLLFACMQSSQGEKTCTMLLAEASSAISSRC